MVKIQHSISFTLNPQFFETLLADNIDTSLKEINKQKKAMFSYQQPQALFIYQQQFQGFISVGIVAQICLKDYQNGYIKKHENTLIRQNLNVQTYRNYLINPVTLGYEDISCNQYTNKIQNLITNILKQKIIPIYAQWTTKDSRKHILRRLQKNNIKISKYSNSIISLFQQINTLYILDGHHRFSAAYQNYKQYHQKIKLEKYQNYQDGSDTDSDQCYKDKANWIQAILYSSKNISVQAQHRMIRNPAKNDLNQYSLLAWLESNNVEVVEIKNQINQQIIQKYQQSNKYKRCSDSLLDNLNYYDTILVIRQKTYGIRIKHKQINTQLNVKLIDEYILLPYFMGCKKQLDQNLQFIPGIVSIQKILQKCQFYQNCYALFLIKPISIQKLFECAQNNNILPPKSTWIQPKPCMNMILRSSN